MDKNKIRAPYNRTITLNENEKVEYGKKLLSLKENTSFNKILNKTIHQTLEEAVKYLPEEFVDLLFLDPPYNLYKKFNSSSFNEMKEEVYEEWFSSILLLLKPLLKKNATIYICCDWKTSQSVYNAAKKYFIPQNRITWEREKGRGAKNNWKNCSEDIWFFTNSDNYTFNIENVKIKRKVIAPYKDSEGKPKDWKETEDGNFRITHPSNLWNDITIPFWSMPENTDHPTQKPEKLLAKLILASTNEGDIILDPFLGSGTTSVTAKKLNRNFIGIEKDLEFCLLAEKRLKLAETNKEIQGFVNGFFWERNTLEQINKDKRKKIKL